MPYVLVGRLNGQLKVAGPFEQSDDAREMANRLGLPGAEWHVTPLMPLHELES